MLLNLQHTFYNGSLEWNLTKPPDELLERLDELSVNLTPCCCKAATVLFGSLVPSVFSPVFSRPQRARRIFNRSQYCCVSPSPALPVLTPELLLMEPALLLDVTTNKSKTLEKFVVERQRDWTLSAKAEDLLINRVPTFPDWQNSLTFPVFFLMFYFFNWKLDPF